MEKINCNWIVPSEKNNGYPKTTSWFINLATHTHGIPSFASGFVSLKCNKEEIIEGYFGETYDFILDRKQDLIGNFSLAILVPPKWKIDKPHKMIKKISIHYDNFILTLTGEKNYDNAVEAGLWPWKTNNSSSQYFLIPLMFSRYVYSSLCDENSMIRVELEDFSTSFGKSEERIKMSLTGFGVLMHNELRERLCEKPKPVNNFNDLINLSCAKYKQPDKNEVLQPINLTHKNELVHKFNLPFYNDCKAIIVEFSESFCLRDSEKREVLPIKFIDIYWEEHLALHAHAADAREYYWKLCKLQVPNTKSFIIPLSLDLVTPHSSSFDFNGVAGKTIHLIMNPDWKITDDTDVKVTIKSIGHEVLGQFNM